MLSSKQIFQPDLTLCRMSTTWLPHFGLGWNGSSAKNNPPLVPILDQQFSQRHFCDALFPTKDFICYIAAISLAGDWNRMKLVFLCETKMQLIQGSETSCSNLRNWKQSAWNRVSKTTLKYILDHLPWFAMEFIADIFESTFLSIGKEKQIIFIDCIINDQQCWKGDQSTHNTANTKLASGSISDKTTGTIGFWFQHWFSNTLQLLLLIKNIPLSRTQGPLRTIW